MADQRANIIITGFDRSKAAFESFTRNAEIAQSKIGGLVGGMGKLTAVSAVVTAGFAALSNIRAIAILDQLDELAEKTGISVENLSALRYASEVAGTPMEALTGGLARLSKQMAAAAGGNKEAAATFDLLGVKVKNVDGTLRSSDEVLMDLADRFASYEDGAAKAALAQALFGKSGADMIPILNQGRAGVARLREEAAKLGAIYDGDVAKAAAQFNDNLAKLKLASEAAAVSIAGPMVQALATLSDKLVEAKKNGGWMEAWWASYKNWGRNFWSSGDMLNFEDGQKGRSTADIQAWVNSRGGPSAGGGRGFSNPKVATPIIPTETKDPKAPADDPTKKLLDNQLKVWERAIAEQEKLLGQRNKFLDLYNSQGLLSVERYYDAQQAAQDEAVAAQVKGYDAQLQALKDYQAKAAKATDKAEAQGKIDALEAKRAETLQEAGLKALELDLKRGEAKKELLKTEKDITAQFAELNGNLVQAAGLKFDAQFEKAAEIFRANLLPGMTDMLARMREITVAQAQINAVTQKFSVIQGDLQMAEERITMALERGTMGQITALQKSGEVRRKAYADMQAQLQRYVDLESQVGLTDEQRQSFERLKLQAEQLGATLDPLANRFDTIFNDAAGSLLYDLTDKTKSGKTAILDFFDSIERQATALISKQIGSELMTSLFGDVSKGGGIGGLFSQLLGGGSGGAKSGGGIGGLFGSLFAGFFAEGGTIPAGQFGIAGERGMELIEGPATVTPLHKLGGSRTVNQVNHYVLPNREARQTQNQIAQINRRALERAGRLA